MSQREIGRAAVLRGVAGLLGVALLLTFLAALLPAARSVLDQGYLDQGLPRLAAETLAEGTGRRMVPAAILVASVLLLPVALWARLRPASTAPGRLLRIAGGRTVGVTGILTAGAWIALQLFAWHHREVRRPAGPNVVLIVIDTLRADHVGVYGHRAATTPSLDRFAQGAFLFRNAYSPSSWTRPAVASILTSLGPLDHGITSESASHALGPRFLTLAEYLRNDSYRTQAIVTNPHYHFGVQQSFDGVRYIGNGWAESVYRRAEEYVREHRNERFFLLLHNNDPHDAYEYHPRFSTRPESSPFRKVGELLPAANSGGPGFDSPENRDGTVILTDGELAELKENYDGEIAYLDHHLGGFLDSLRELGLDEETLVIITADHGEEFLDHGSYWHGGTLYDELLRVPLMMRVPGRGGGVRDERVSTLDLFPTLIELLGGTPPGGVPMRGTSLVPLLEDRGRPEQPLIAATAFRGRLKYGLIAGDDKLIRYADGELIGLFDLAADPRERHDLSAAQPDRLQRMERLLSRILESSAAPPDAGGPVELDEKTRRELRSLGYAG